MITIITKTTTIFVNDKVAVRVEYDRMKGVATVYYPHDCADNRLLKKPMPPLTYEDVTSVGFTSEAQPTSLVFNTKGKHDGT